jgi:hypothetical protein
MRTLIVPTLFATLALTALAGPKDEWVQKQRVERAALELFRSGSSASAVAQLRQNVRPEPGPGGDTVALTQHLVDIAVSFYNSREMHFARAATAQALAAAAPLLNGNGATLPAASRRADLFGSLGLLQESVMFDLVAAQKLYDAAAALNPGDKLHKRRSGHAAEKLKFKAGGSR